MRGLIEETSAAIGGHKFGLYFLLTEWEQVVDAWQLKTWEEYRDVARLRKKDTTTEAQRLVLWSIFERVREELKKRNAITYSELFTTLGKSNFNERKRCL